MMTERREKITSRAAILLIILATLGNLLFLLIDESDTAGGYDHNTYSTLLHIYDRARGMGDRQPILSMELPYSLLYVLALGTTAVFGLNDFALMLVPTFGYGLILLFSYLIGKQLGNGRHLSGLFAAASAALCPFIFGLARRFSPWALIIGFYLALLYASLAYREKPTLKRAISIAVSFALGLSATHDTTTRFLFISFALPPIALAFFESLKSRKKSTAILSSHLFIVLVIPLCVFLIPYFIQNYRISYGYYFSESARFASQHGWQRTLLAYFPDVFLHLLAPPAALVLLPLFALFPFFHDRKSSLFMVGFPIFAFIVMALIPKKNSWYILEILCFVPIAAGAALDRLMIESKPRIGATFFVLWISVLLPAYIASFFVPAPIDESYLQGVFDRTTVIWKPVEYDKPCPSLRKRVGTFMKRYDDFFPKDTPIKLGIVMKPWIDIDFVPYYIRSHGRPVDVFFSALAINSPTIPVPDAVLLVPPNCDMAKASGMIENDDRFFRTYSQPIFDLYMSHEGYVNSDESVGKMLFKWRSAEVTDFPEYIALIRFHANNEAP